MQIVKTTEVWVRFVSKFYLILTNKGQVGAFIGHIFIVTISLFSSVRFLYDDFMGQASTKETLSGGSFMSVINVLMQLRKVCNHPDLFEGTSATTTSTSPSPHSTFTFSSYLSLKENYKKKINQTHVIPCSPRFPLLRSSDRESVSHGRSGLPLVLFRLQSARKGAFGQPQSRLSFAQFLRSGEKRSQWLGMSTVRVRK